MNLRLITPLTIEVDTDILSLQAEDASGRFGILPGHADIISALEVSVLSWTDASNVPHFAAIRGGLLSVKHGQQAVVATREAVLSDDLTLLDQSVLDRLRSEVDAERTEHSESLRLQISAIRRMVSTLADSGYQAGVERWR